MVMTTFSISHTTRTAFLMAISWTNLVTGKEETWTELWSFSLVGTGALVTAVLVVVFVKVLEESSVSDESILVEVFEYIEGGTVLFQCFL